MGVLQCPSTPHGYSPSPSHRQPAHGQPRVCIEAVLFRPVFLAPGTKVHLVNAHRALLRICLVAFGQSSAVSPAKTLDIVS